MGRPQRAPPAASPAVPLPSAALVYGLALAVRLLNAFLSRAFFQPDETWQALEPAHRWVWGFGWETWEWRVQSPHEVQHTPVWAMVAQGGRGGIRSPLAALPSAVAYAVLRVFGWESSALLALAPRLVQACIAASTDVAVFQLANRILGPTFANAAVFASLSSFFNLHTATRTLSNSTETALTAWAWVFWPWEWLEEQVPTVAAELERDKRHASSAHAGTILFALALAAVATLLRPSNAVIWLFLGAHLFLKSSRRRCVAMLRAAAFVLTHATLSSLALDTAFYGTPTFTPLRFLHVNVLRSISHFYGVNSPHFYLSQGIPLLLTTQLPFFLDGVARLVRRRGQLPVRSPVALRSLAIAAAGTLAVYSLLAHKEWRFLHPLLPVIHLFVAFSLVQHGLPSSPSASGSHPERARSLPLRLLGPVGIRPAHALLLLSTLLPALYLTAFHGLGQVRVTAYLHHLQPPAKSVGFLMPCHSTPWQAGMHAAWLEPGPGGDDGETGNCGRGARAWFLTCEPPLQGQNPATYRDQSDHFYASPCTYLRTRFPPHVDPTFPPSPAPSPPKAGAQPQPVSAAASGLSSDDSDDDDGSDLGWSHAWPERIVLFSSLLDVQCNHRGDALDRDASEATFEEELVARGYVEERRWWNTLGGWHEDARRRGDVRVLVWGGAEAHGAGAGASVGGKGVRSRGERDL